MSRQASQAFLTQQIRNIDSELERIEARYELESDEGGTAREKAIEIYNLKKLNIKRKNLT